MAAEADIKKWIDDEIKNLVLPDSPEELYEPVKYMLAIGGKRIRPILTILAARVFNDDISQAMPAALAMEIFHNFTLIHDDILDAAPLRRGIPTVHEKWDINRAILSGDVMLVKAYELLCSCPKEIIPDLLGIFNKTATEVCEGQQLDMNFENAVSVSVDDYIRMITLKTSVLLGCCAYSGALCAGASKKDAESVYAFGRNLGISFQIRDDIIDAWGSEKSGKKKGGDIARNKKTFLWLKTIEKSANPDIFSGAIAAQTEEIKINSVLRLYEQYAVKEDAIKEEEKYFNLACENVKNLSADTAKKEILLSFAEKVRSREF